MYENAQKFVTTPSYSMVKIAHLDDIFSEIFELEGSTIEGQPLLQKDKKRCKKGKNKKTQEPIHVGHFLKIFILHMPKRKWSKMWC